MDKNNKRNPTKMWIFNIWANQHNIRIEDSKAIRLL